MLENFFLTYANYSIRDDIKNLDIIFNEIEGGPTADPVITNLYYLIKQFAGKEYSPKYDNQLLHTLKEILKPILEAVGTDLFGFLEQEPLEWIKDLVFGVPIERCKTHCRENWKVRQIKILLKMNIARGNRFKCYGLTLL